MLMMLYDISGVLYRIYEVFEVCDDCAHTSAGAAMRGAHVEITLGKGSRPQTSVNLVSHKVYSNCFKVWSIAS